MREFTAVSVEDGRPAWVQKRGEQPLFRGAVLRHIAVIVKVIPGQVGKPGCRHGETVKPALVEAVARGFDRYVLNATRNQTCEITVERDRVRGRQSAGARPGRGHQTESTKARGGKADCCPDLADKMND